MKDKFEMFNDTKIDENDYGEVILSEEEKENMKNRMNRKINIKKKNYKKQVMAASLALIVVGSITFNSETTWAYIEKVGKQIEVLLGRNNEEFKGYKVEVSQSKEIDGLKFHLNELMLDDGQIILSMNMDYSNFDYEKLNMEEKNLRPNISRVTVDDLMYAGMGWSIDEEQVEGKKEKNFLIKADLIEIDTDGDFIGDTPYELLDNMKHNKDYNIKVEFNFLNYETKELNEINKDTISDTIGIENHENEILYEGSYPIDLEFKTIINTSNIIKETEILKIDKKINVKDGDKNGVLVIEEARISPVSLKLKYTFESKDINDMYEPTLLARDEKGEILKFSTGGTGEGNVLYLKSEFELKGNERKVIITPQIQKGNKTKEMKDESIEIKIPKK